jgi:hypothetical protein
MPVAHLSRYGTAQRANAVDSSENSVSTFRVYRGAHL